MVTSVDFTKGNREDWSKTCLRRIRKGEAEKATSTYDISRRLPREPAHNEVTRGLVRPTQPSSTFAT